ncbi:amino acid ABC transporter permease [Mesorhizobium sp. M7A.F.Ca.US.014.04.1.1]|uniref:amino acid ABC transporter permease n=2 Tax=Phyllobacteriaceae TaxID=69277 RepID=UPI0007A93799|nr:MULTISPECIES: amino acid ABC transporter permease [Mesorhizobium]AMX94276.1 amino acid ABC transporter permease [Mesorhizobium ciceri]MDF3209056.1 amino acid ABC transporter permease [Mesorhizobium sp. LMG15046]MDF3228371.1 amino acid ABC transporter permease [Mesorhizobium sp. DSM 30133]RUU19956.1 amino acid ABC transporter permease [Mesorhizobium sp. Primo-B]RUU36531.1 amino acid ABC transporter permease [Mesorhizobium sp. Primo-A]
MSFDFGLFWSTLFSGTFFRAALVALALTILAHAAAILLSLPLALALNGQNKVLRWGATAYIAVFRALPALLLLLFVWNGLPQIWPIFRETWFSPFIAALLALTLNEAAYQVEINRAALSAVEEGQFQAGAALGLRKPQVFFLIVVPQALRIALPPTVNEFITLLKTTSLASVISLTELMAVTQQSVASTFRYAEFYAVTSLYYLAMVYVLMILQKRIERRFAWAKPHAAGNDTDKVPHHA